MSDASSKWSASRVAMGVAALVSLFVLVPVGCGAPSMFGPDGEGGASASTGHGVASGTGAGDPGDACSPEGSKKSCHTVIGTYNGVTDCLDGVQVCFQGKWGICSPGSTTPMAHRGPLDPEEGSFQAGARPQLPTQVPQSSGAGGPTSDPPAGTTGYATPLGSESMCPTDPCNPNCWEWTEPTPSGGQAMGTLGTTWFIPSRGTVTGTNGKPGYQTPCGAAWDCNFDQYCSNPVTQGGFCGHDKCAPGGGLGFCNDDCVQAVIGVHGYCSLNWDANCVKAVYTLCGQDCVNNEPACEHDICLTGGPLSPNCDNAQNACVNQVCTDNPGCCTPFVGSWDNNCVNAVNYDCGLTCPTAAQTGVCLPWAPGQTDPQCGALPDLTLGLVCNENTMAGMPDVIPVCNVGGAPANAPITLFVYNGGSGHAPNYPPGNNAGTWYVINQSIAAGKCIDFPVPGTNNNDELFINPTDSLQASNGVTGGGPQITECNFQNNWGYRTGGGSAPKCDTPSCAPTQSTVLVRYPHLFIETDRSPTGILPTATFDSITGGLYDFFGDTSPALANAQISVQANEFPHGGSCAATGFFDSSCPSINGGATPCTNGVSLTPLAGNVGTFQGWASGLAQSGADPPYYSALGTALNAAVADYNTGSLWTQPEPVVVLILGTDPKAHQSCGTHGWQASALTGLATAAYANTGGGPQAVRTYVIWVGAPELGQDYSQIALQSGGKFYITSGANIRNDVHSFLLDIATNEAYPCVVPLPPTGTFSTVSPNIFVQVNGVNTPIPQDQTCSTAAGGWYWLPNPGAPTEVGICPQLCQTYSTSLAQPTYVAYKTGCNATYTTSSVPAVTYMADKCPLGTEPEWRWLAYDTSDPGGSWVDFFVQTPALSSPLKVASTNSQPAVCPLGGPNPCPIDLVGALNHGLPTGAAVSPTITVSAQLNPDASMMHGPSINSWTVEYSCIQAE